MRTIELRHLISEHLSHIEDVSFLNSVKTIVESKASESIYKHSDYQKEQIDLARDMLNNGQTISQEDLQKEMVQWLGSK